MAKIAKIRYLFDKCVLFFLGDAVFPEKKTPEGICDTVEKGLGPRPLGPIGPIFRRTITVTRNIKKVLFPKTSFAQEIEKN